MAQAPDARTNAGQKVVEELKVSAHLMTLERGLFCVFHAPGSQLVDAATGLPGVRVSLPPDNAEDVSIRTFRDDGWIGGDEAAALIKVPTGPAQVLITIYQRPGATEPPPKIQIQQLSTGSAAGAAAAPAPAAAQAAAPAAPQAAPAAAAAAAPADPASAEVSAHIQRRGDVVAKVGEWMGERGSQRWIEGFSIAPAGIAKEDLEYQAVLGRGWLSPWADGGQYCGSRRMALPILGLRVRLKGAAAQSHTVRVSASFTDGSSAGPVDGSRACEAESLAPLEAFLVEIVPNVTASQSAPAPTARAVSRPAAAPAKPAPVAAKKTKPAPAAPAPAPARSRAAPVAPPARTVKAAKPVSGKRK